MTLKHLATKQSILAVNSRKMWSLNLCLFALLIAAANTRILEFNEYSMPITKVESSIAVHNNERVDYIEATILPRHISKQSRIDFPTGGPLDEKFLLTRHPGDERGGLIGSQFSGPPEWYNLSPYNARANRKTGYRAITADWFKLECAIRLFLNKGSQGGERFVTWKGNQTYVGDSNRPDSYFVSVEFNHNGEVVETKKEKFRNPFLREDSNFYTCKCTGKKRRPSECSISEE